MHEEFAFHLDMRVDDLIQERPVRSDARAQARRSLATRRAARRDAPEKGRPWSDNGRWRES